MGSKGLAGREDGDIAVTVAQTGSEGTRRRREAGAQRRLLAREFPLSLRSSWVSCGNAVAFPFRNRQSECGCELAGARQGRHPSGLWAAAPRSPCTAGALVTLPPLHRWSLVPRPTPRVTSVGPGAFLKKLRTGLLTKIFRHVVHVTSVK